MNQHPSDDETVDAHEAPGGEARGAPGIFPMRVAVQLTGLTQDTIRAWERRYHAIEPVRSAGNTRKFTQDDIRRLLLLREATEAGHSIGNIAELEEPALRALAHAGRPMRPGAAMPSVASAPGLRVPLTPLADTAGAALGPALGEGAGAVEGYLALVGRFAIAEAAAWLRRLAALHPPRVFVLEVVAPVLAEMRERRADARLGGPHVAAAWQQLTAALQVLLEVTAAPRGAPVLMTVGLPRQRHAIGAMAAALLARNHGCESVFLGLAVPEADALWALDALGAETVIFDLSVPLSVEVPPSLATFERLAARSRVWVLMPPGSVAPASAAAGVELATELAQVDALLGALERGR